MESRPSSPPQPFWSRFTMIAAVIAALLWVSVNTYILSRFTLLGTDSVMYASPIAAAHHSFHLGIPFLDNFAGYGTAWGHQWPGAMLLMSGIFALVPYHRWIDIFVHLLMLLGVGALSGFSVWRLTGRRGLAWLATVLVCSDRILLTSAIHGLPLLGILTISILMAFSVLSASAQASRMWRSFALLAAFIAPLAHPYSMILAGSLIFFSGAQLFLVNRRSTKFTFFLLGSFVLGIVGLAAWFLLQPEALAQFITNLKLQKTFYTHYDSVIQGLGNYRYGIGYIVWAWAGLVSVTILLSWRKSPGIFTEGDSQRRAIQLYALLFLSLAGLHTLTRCENFGYLGYATPLTAVLIAVSISFLAKRIPQALAFAPGLAFAALTLLAFSLYPYRIYQYWRAGCPDLEARLAHIIATLPTGNTVYIPPSFWNVACQDPSRNYRFWTFCVASPKEQRRQYESQAYRSAKEGDVLIIDELSANIPDKFGLAPTFKISPPDTVHWAFQRRETQIFSGHVPWGIDFSIYRFKGTAAD